MAGRLLMGLLISPVFGLAAIICSLPALIASVLVFGALGLVAGASLIVSPIVGLIALVLIALLADVALYVQAARFAGAFTRLAWFDKQPTFGMALKRGIGVVVVLKVLLFLTSLAVLLLMAKYGGEDTGGWLSGAELAAIVEQFSAPIVQDGIIVLQNDDTATALLALRVIGIVFLTLAAIVIVPRATGLGWEYDGTWTVNFILFRLLIVMPALALFVGVVTVVIVLLLDALLASVVPEARPSANTLYSIEYLLYLGAIFVMEAVVLKAGFAQDQDGERQARELSIISPDDYRALRESRSEQP